MTRIGSALGFSVVPLLAGALAAMAPITTNAETFRWGGRTDPATMDPHAQNTAPVLGFLNNVYEGLVRRGKDMGLEPALAESWEPIEGGWRFHLRRGVKFHNGEDFTAEDVLFTWERSKSESSSVRSFLANSSEARIVDDFTIDIMTTAPAIFVEGIANWMILDKGWAEANGTLTPGGDDNYANLNANGTGAFRVADRDPDVRTVLVPFEDWWDTAEHNITEAIFTPITTQATRLAALLSGEIDFMEPIPPQDVDRVASTEGFKVLEAPEARVIFLGFHHDAEALASSDLGDVNPFQDARVREAVYHAINIDPIIDRIMRGHATPAGLIIDPTINGFRDELNSRREFNQSRSRELLADAGYLDGFSFAMRCPNNRYINDEPICTAVASMLAQVGIEVDLQTFPVRQYFGAEGPLRKGEFDMYMLGWSPGTFDAEHPIRFLMATPGGGVGSWNFGGYSNARVDELLPRIQVELDTAARQAMIDEVHTILRDDVVYVPLHVQPLLWAAKDNIELSQRADNFLILRWITVN
ncbi:MAG: ABC transporter substrate-binding protein [Alphaproteobacteria bacterium]